jgi:hypothetical protein
MMEIFLLPWVLDSAVLLLDSPFSLFRSDLNGATKQEATRNDSARSGGRHLVSPIGGATQLGRRGVSSSRRAARQRANKCLGVDDRRPQCAPVRQGTSAIAVFFSQRKFSQSKSCDSVVKWRRQVQRPANPSVGSRSTSPGRPLILSWGDDAPVIWPSEGRFFNNDGL